MKAYDGVPKRRYGEWTETYGEDPFIVDFDKITQSRAFRRLFAKTQVICDPDNPHVRSRCTHCFDVCKVASEIGSGLKLNVNLIRAIAIGHDIGHTPFGHVGERVLSKHLGKPFLHSVNGAIVAQKIEKEAGGLNLTLPVLQGILLHSRKFRAKYPDMEDFDEAKVVRIADKIAFIFSDINDLLRYDYMKTLPSIANYFGGYKAERIMTVVKAVVDESLRKGKVSFSEGEVYTKFKELEKYMYDEHYYKMDFELQTLIMEKILFYFKGEEEFSDVDPIVLTSLLTDKEATDFGKLLLKTKNPSIEDIKHFGIFEIVNYIRGKKIDLTDPDINEDDFTY